MNKITAKVTLKNGAGLSLSRVYAKDSKPDKNHIVNGKPLDNYYCTYRPKKEPKGYIFREVRFNHGISGHYKTLRDLVLNTVLFSSIDVYID